MRPLLPDSVAAIALPVFYAEQLHGILYIESSVPVEFSEEEVLLLRTLADLIAGALHNALSFQKSAGASHHRRAYRREDASVFHGSIVRGMEAFHSRRPRVCSRAHGPRPLQIRQRFLWPPRRRPRFAAGRADPGNQLPALRCRCPLRRGRVRHSDAGNQYGTCPAVGQQASRLGIRRSTVARKKYQCSFGIACYPLHGSSPQELIQVADASMYLSKHQGGNAVSTADHFDPNEAKKWKRDVLEAYLGVTLKRLSPPDPKRSKRSISACGSSPNRSRPPNQITAN